MYILPFLVIFRYNLASYMRIYKNFNLKNYNAFKLTVFAKYFAKVNTISDLKKLLKKYRKEKKFILGDGFNTLFTKNFNGLVIKINIKGIRFIKDLPKSVLIEVGAGEDWNKFVLYSVNNNFSGIENLALIPGTVGAAPIQNIAAYGQSFGETALKIKGININTLKEETILAKNCKLYYRDSLFKHELSNKFVITSVIVKLFKESHYDLNYHGRLPYESLKAELSKYGHEPYSPKDIAKAVIHLRKIKMPDFKKIGTAGSFFKNPFVSKSKFEDLKKIMPDLQAYPINKMLYPHPNDPVFKLANFVKIPAGRLLDELGWKGKIINRVGTFKNHALVVINNGNATPKDIITFTNAMKKDVYINFKIQLETEVNII